ncbi:pentapeptide repeat-containing protein [Bradyrhizobium sp. SYSU BS000235]|uniref:pentapeptide repeat-containing protein n=1 Tax=Bradyrhizobium sp. SYSU BS000235 TaxID=3411332 RepID=UPI003C73161A
MMSGVKTDESTNAGKIAASVATVNSASEVARKSWLGLSSLLVFLLVTVAGITHIDLLLDSPAKLPLVSIPVPLVGFYIVGPALLVIAHFSLLLQHELLHQKIRSLQVAINSQVGRARREAIGYWSQVDTYFFTQALSRGQLSLPVSLSLAVVTSMSVVLFPAAVLFYFQVTFLPYHKISVTWWHRICLLCDVALLLFYAESVWSVMRANPRRGASRSLRPGVFPLSLRSSLVVISNRIRSRRLIRAARLLGHFGIIKLALSLLCLFSIAIATVPDEFLDRIGRRLWPVRVPLYAPDRMQDPLAGQSQRLVFYPTAFFFERYWNQSSNEGPGFLGLSRNLVIVGSDLSGRSFRYRNLDYVTFSRVKLEGADFRFASLSGGRFLASQAQKTDFYGATMRAAQFIVTQAQEAQFGRGRLERILTIGSRFNGANFDNAVLSLAELDNSDFDGASFDGVDLEAAYVYQSKMRGVIFDAACLQGMVFTDRGAIDDGFSYEDSGRMNDFRGSSFRGAGVWQSVPPFKQAVQYVDFENVGLSAVGTSQKERLSTLFESLTFVAIPEVVERRIYDLLSPDSPNWKSSSESKIWSNFLKSVENTAATKDRGQFLGKLICNDDSNEGWTAKAIARHLDAPSTAKEILQGAIGALDQLDCAGSRKIDESLKARLKRHAQTTFAWADESLTEKRRDARWGGGKTMRTSICSVD